MKNWQYTVLDLRMALNYMFTWFFPFPKCEGSKAKGILKWIYAYL